MGGFDFAKNKFNHVAKAWRQPAPASSHSSTRRHWKRIHPSTVINDAPLFFDAGGDRRSAWEPKNYDGKFEGPMTLRQGLAKSKNMISIQILRSIGAQYAQDWITRFGFDAESTRRT